MEQIIKVFEDYKVNAFFTKKLDNLENLKKFLLHKIYLPIQRHTDLIIILKDNLTSQIADAVITDQKLLFIGIRTADCVPVLIYSPEKKVIGAVHAGWRGTAKGILRKTILKMIETYECNPEKILIAIGPYIKGCCYEVGEDVIEAIREELTADDFIMRKNGKFHIDLGIANSIQAIRVGIRKENILILSDCTYCKSYDYASYRFHGKKAGRQYGIIGMI